MSNMVGTVVIITITILILVGIFITHDTRQEQVDSANSFISERTK